MPAYATLFGAILPVFVVIGAGTLTRVFGFFPAEFEQPFGRLNLTVFYPCMVLSYTLGNPALMTPAGLLGAPVIGFGITVFGIIVALAAGMMFKMDPFKRRTFAFVTGINNYGYLPVPLSVLLFDQETTGVLLVFTVGVEVAMWTAGVMTLVGELRAAHLRKLVNPPVISLVAAIVLNLTGASAHVPQSLFTVLKFVGNYAIPCGLLLIGAVLLDLAKRMDWKGEIQTTFIGLVLRLGILPLVILAVAWFLPHANTDLRRVLVLEAAMPCAIFPIVITKFYQGDTSLALRLVLATTLPAIFLIPLWLNFGLHWLGIH